MGKRKVIEDSDDEDNAETTPQRQSNVGLSEATACAYVDLEASPDRSNGAQLTNPSTSSTGS